MFDTFYISLPQTFLLYFTSNKMTRWNPFNDKIDNKIDKLRMKSIRFSIVAVLVNKIYLEST